MRVTIATPISFITQANELALFLGKSVADRKTFSKINYKDEYDNFYSVVSVNASEDFPIKATTTLVPPHFAKNANTTLASFAQEKLQVFTTSETPTANTYFITAHIHEDVRESISQMNLTPVDKEKDEEANNLPFEFDSYNANTGFYFGETFDTSYEFDFHDTNTGLYYGYYFANTEIQ